MSEDLRPLSSLAIPPSTLSALTRAGYETVNDVHSQTSADELTNALKIPLAASQALLSSQSAHETMALPLTQSAASLARSKKHKIRSFSTRCPPVDKLLGGGLPRGHVLEVSGPPGSPKENILLNIVRSFAEAGESILFVDCQNMCNPSLIDRCLQGVADARKLVVYIKIHTLLDLIVFMNNLSSYLESDQNISLLVLSSISFPFQYTPEVPPSAKAVQLEQVKQILAKNCTSRSLSVAATTQLSTKMINIDGSSGSFDTAGAQGVLVPQLGAAYLPPGRSHRILFSLESREIGSPSKLRVRLLTTSSNDKAPSGKVGEPMASEPFALDWCAPCEVAGRH